MRKKSNSREAFVLIFFFFALLIACSCEKVQNTDERKSLKVVFEGKFYLGTAINEMQTLGRDARADSLIKLHFNSITAENAMKSESIQPEEGKFNFELADKFVEFGEKNNMFIIGHTLIWHSQAPKWFFVDAEGNEVGRDVMIERMRKHIATLVGRYKGRVHGWDVVNEAIEDDGSWRKNKFYEIIGKDYVKLAFQFAHKADPEAELYYNDYSMAHGGRRNGVVKMVKELQRDSIRVDGIGMQAHLNMDFPQIVDFEKSIQAFSALGVDILITEMDLTVLPWPTREQTADVSLKAELSNEMNPYPGGMPDSAKTVWNARFLAFFRLFNKHSDKISRVTLWGVHDNQTWRNNWPIKGRTDYPLLFDRDYNEKSFLAEIYSINEKL